MSSEPLLKRPSSSLSELPNESASKRLKRPYHHHHRLQCPVIPIQPEPAITDDICVDHLMNRAIGQSLREAGFDLADPVALDSFRNATEEYLLKFASYIRQSMLACRRIQPIPHDFEHALKRSFLRVDDLLPYLKPAAAVEPIPTLLPSPPPEDDPFKSLPFLSSELSGEDDRVRSAYIPKHFPGFPSKHTYRYTPIFTEREQDPRKIRERATEDGRHGEEALRKLARAASKDTHLGAVGREKKLWGRRMESMDSMFEKTVKGLAKRMQKNASVGVATEMDAGPLAEQELKPPRSKVSFSFELGPIVNCERNLWRRTTASGNNRRLEEKPLDVKDGGGLTRVDSWVST